MKYFVFKFWRAADAAVCWRKPFRYPKVQIDVAVLWIWILIDDPTNTARYCCSRFRVPSLVLDQQAPRAVPAAILENEWAKPFHNFERFKITLMKALVVLIFGQLICVNSLFVINTKLNVAGSRKPAKSKVRTAWILFFYNSFWTGTWIIIYTVENTIWLLHITL